MANSSSTKQKLESSIKNQLGLEFDIDQSTSCNMAADAGQTMENITISGSRDVQLKQISELENLCYSTSIAKLDVFNELTAAAQNDIMKSLEQEGGIGLNLSNTTTDVLNTIENDVGVEAKIDMSKKCLSEVQAPQVMSGITIEDAMNIDLTQESANFNKCILDSATDVAQKQGIELDATTKVTEDVTQKGWDPIASLGGLVGNVGLVALAPAITSVVVVCLSIVASSVMTASGMGGQGSSGQMEMEMGAYPPVNTEYMAGQTAGAISAFFGVRSRKGKRLITLFVKIALVVVVVWGLYKLLFSGSQSRAQTQIRESYHSGLQQSSTDVKPHHYHRGHHLVLRHQYHHPHISEDLFPSHRTHPDVYPEHHIPAYVKRWW